MERANQLKIYHTAFPLEKRVLRTHDRDNEVNFQPNGTQKIAMRD